MFNFFANLNGFAYMLVCASAITHISRQGLFNLFLYQVELIFSCFSRHIITHVHHSTIKPTRGSSFYCLQVFGQVGEITNVRKLLWIWSVMASNNSNNFDTVTFHMPIMESFITDNSVVNEGIKISQIENFLGIGLKSTSPMIKIFCGWGMGRSPKRWRYKANTTIAKFCYSDYVFVRYMPWISLCFAIFLTAILLPHGQLWTILKGTASLTWC